MWIDLSCAVDSQGNTLQFHVNATRDVPAAKHCLSKALEASHTTAPRVATGNKHAAYPKALQELQTAGVLSVACELRQGMYLNNLVAQDYRFMKRLVTPGLGFFSFETARKLFQG